MKVLDLFSCEGGASQGYINGGLELLAGIDNEPKHVAIYNQKFPGKGHVMDWKEGLDKFGSQADIIHASPPCQRFSSQSWDRAKAEVKWANLIPPVREALRKLGKPYVIENVAGARKELINPVMLNGFMFRGLTVDWTPPNQRQRIANETWQDGNQRHWHECKHTGHKAYFCYPQKDVPTHWTIKRNRYFEIHGFTITPPPELRPAGHEVMSVTVSSNPTMVWNKINRQSVPLWVRSAVMGGLVWMSARGVGESIPPPYAEEIARQFQEGVNQS